jgi:heme/copper-type cytochrome/quinol oxidase subunit 4
MDDCVGVVSMTAEEHQGVVSSLTSLGQTALTSVPPAFLVLAAMNVIFVLGLLYFLHLQSAPRERLLTQIVAACLKGQ